MDIVGNVKIVDVVDTDLPCPPQVHRYRNNERSQCWRSVCFGRQSGCVRCRGVVDAPCKPPECVGDVHDVEQRSIVQARENDALLLGGGRLGSGGRDDFVDLTLEESLELNQQVFNLLLPRVMGCKCYTKFGVT